MGQCVGVAETFQWTSLIGPTAALLGVVLTVFLGVRTTTRTLRANAETAQETLRANAASTQRTLRANIMTSHRLKWLDLLRDDLPLLLFLGEELYKPQPPLDPAAQVKVREELRRVSKRLIVLMGLENTLRMELADLVRKFTDQPSDRLGDEIQVKAQQVFRARWNQVREETGEPPRDIQPIRRIAGGSDRKGEVGATEEGPTQPPIQG